MERAIRLRSGELWRDKISTINSYLIKITAIKSLRATSTSPNTIIVILSRNTDTCPPENPRHSILNLNRDTPKHMLILRHTQISTSRKDVLFHFSGFGHRSVFRLRFEEERETLKPLLSIGIQEFGFEMMKMRNMRNGVSSMNGISTSTEWEMRPGGMLVQRRTAESDRNSVPPPTIRVRVKYGSTYHEVNISSQATFGELKKMLSGPTGLHHQDQKLFYKEKERDSKAFLDAVGVKDKSKMVLMEDPISQEKRYLEMRKNAKMERSAKSISEISLEVDRLGGQVSALESIISKGGKIAETEVHSLIELLMNQLLKLDGIVADGDVKLQRKMQVKRVQKYVETLDMLKVKNSMAGTNGGHAPRKVQQKHSNRQRLAPIQEQPESVSKGQLAPNEEHQQHQPSRHSTSEVVVTTKWETFDSLPPLIPVTSTTPTSSSLTNNSVHPNPKFNWEFFD
ncbi:BAG family molecular chaperone regulator 1, partial [Mucuna pruriens]